jgi:2-oxoglutarate dehydrogenase E1 component
MPTSEDEPYSSQLDFFSHLSPEYIESLYMQFKENPRSVSPDFALIFEILSLAQSTAPGVESSAVADEFRVLSLIEGYRMRGHLLAQIDPLGLWKPPLEPHLDRRDFKLDQVDPQRQFEAARELGLPPSTLSQILEHLRETYCRFIGVEFHFIRDENLRRWLLKRIEENKNQSRFDAEEKLRILKHLYRASIFESFLQSNYTGQKRFSLEGAESLIPALKHAINVCAENGAKEIVIGMAHRGRLNVLANIMEKPYQEIFKEFEGAELPEMAEAMGDVKYHQGYSTDVETSFGQQVHLSLTPNPSHLEWVNPVVEGVVRAKQETKYQNDKNAVVPILIHGDAAVIGQGVVAETLNLAHLNGYGVGGTVHIVINNQIGFTTLPEDSRSSIYCTDFGKAFNCPILHVNGDQVEDVVHAIKLACELRMKFNRDVFVDIFCYRKYGHNEGDEPRFTQPLMYRIIEEHPSPLEIYSKRLTEDQKVDQDQVDQFSNGFKSELDSKRAEIKDSPRILKADMFRGLWQGFELSSEEKLISVVPTEIRPEDFDQVIAGIHRVPTDFKPISKFKKMLEARFEKITKEDQIDWAVGEQLAFGSLLLEGVPVRLSGQDSIRGTFSQRHLAMRDHHTGQRHYFLNELSENQAKISSYDSPLSEAAVLGFDYGYSIAQPKALVLWEAQFGDFANSAQVIIDQFIASAESKWYRMSGLSLLLPHGYEGQGPEHSSARLERFLQLCAQNNMQVCYPTTPAQYAHLLRRQIHRNFRKPLIVMTPKSPLRMPEVVSKKEDFLTGGFQPLLIDISKMASLKRLIFCSGKVYWDLKKEQKIQEQESEVGFVRVEQIYPLDKKQILNLMSQLPEAIELVWTQEEPKNMGAWTFILEKFTEMDLKIRYVGRPAAASPATGSALKHEREQRHLIQESLSFR